MMDNKVKFNVSDETNVIPNDVEDNIDDAVDASEVIQDDEEEQFYASGVYEELRDAMQDTDFRLYLINNDIVVPGTLEGNNIQLLDIVGDDEDKEFVLKDAPQTFDELLDFRTLYNVENAENIPEDKEVVPANHQDIVEYILNLKVTDQDTDDIEDDEQEIKAKENDEKEEENNETNEQ